MPADQAMAANVFWDDAGGSADKNWSNFGNWSPDGSVANDDVWVGTTTLGVNFAGAANDTTIYDAAGTQISSLTIGNGADVDTNQNELIVNGLTTLGGAGTQLIIRQHSSGAAVDSFDTNALTVNSGGRVSMFNGRLEVDSGGVIDLNSGGTIIGTGTIDLEGNPVGITSRILNDGTITANTTPFFIGQAPAAGTLLIQAIGANVADARFDWDGGGSGVLQANGNQTLDIDVSASNDPFSGTMNLNTGSTIDIANTWSLDSGTINANTGAFGLIIIGQDPNPGPGAHIDGANWTMTGGTINIADTWDTLILDSQVTASGGVVNNEGVLEVNGGATFQAGVDFNMTGGGAALVVNSALNIDTPDFNLDGQGLAGNVTTINAGGNLDLDLGAGADLSFDHTINMNGGELDVTSSVGTLFSLGNSASLNAAGGNTSTLNSSSEDFLVNGDINVTANSQLNVNADTIYNPTATVVIEAGSVLNQATTTYQGGSYTGAGVFSKGVATIAGSTTWDVDIVNLDDGSTTVNNGTTLTINADSIDDAGDGFDNTITVQDTGVLEINLTGGADVVFDSAGRLTYNGNAAQSFFLSTPDTGSALRFDAGSIFTVNGDGASSARIILNGGTLDIATVGGDFRLSGGSQVPGNTNEINGGTITGPGQLDINSFDALRGSGSIDVNIAGDGFSQLIAEGGTLNVTDGIVDIGTIGTVTGGTLNVTDTWNTNVTNNVLLQGGTISGSTITNDGAAGINGRGLITSNINNNTRIDAESGTLTIDSPINVIDWDGSGNNGSLNALTGNLTVRDNATFVFAGTVQANAGRTFLADGFELRPGAASNLILNSGVFRSTNATLFQGTATVGAGAASRIETANLSNFGGTANFTLNGNLNLDSTNSRIQAGAFFGGGAGDLVNLNGGLLQLDDGAAISTVLINQGGLTIASGITRGSATVQDFDQTAAGEFNVDISGNGISDLDRISVNGSAFLDGELDVDFVLGFTPNVGDTFAFMTYLAVNGTFGSLDISGLGAGLDAIVNYTGTAAILEIVNALIIDGDYNSDGFVSQADLDLVLLNWGDMSVPAGFEVAAVPGGGPFDGLISQNELDGVLLNWGDGTPPSVAVPEPTTLLTFVAVLGILSTRSPRHGTATGVSRQTN